MDGYFKMEKWEEDLIEQTIESLPVYRGIFIRKKALFDALNEAFPDKEKQK